ncbi:23S rRNA (guanosine(2251)-2'-O)-methyltransferase RlmB [Halobacillus litoralis]|uniref:23S rRNA (Guanosine(2251)-2'-O)-methyltransferase RlmB n=1 Tax=Halobacillus litoralis TaxID=45668 RepID=A0A845DWM3_9BACI|nr:MULTISPECIES: 23S rRNA (guanosine(2251)-2'-O)-methyltransferase RlmB [Halobacillus]MCA1024374.1 23S rRNA (guanosine(2251)-2'-O)-methyltransferase RlmB [Halobacillus litoralis]MYL21930.1 23S rRNA (guanosine(2251)-2'-O)-methyltransferase RlmB [Halobacillus litoralis]MYL31896.1 23S rRNA (guanosine(2251)-2'-O)-methyltransferase RlmB [Halobacillus halophilus]MYL39730.1 23S rRNA (guanosine(2251)-2'-O)-methyltransferase RlmB [Halobacillus litoralis]
MTNGEWIIGKNPVQEALRSGRSINKVMVSDQLQYQAFKKLEQLAKEQGVNVQKVPKKKIDQLVDGSHQGVAASVAAYDYADIEDLFAKAEEKGEAPFFIICDEIEDPHNLGSILRTADAAGAHGVIIPKRRSVALTATVAKTSTGAIEYIPVARVTNLARTIDELKERFVWVVGTDAEGTEDYRQLDGSMPIALVIGSEGRGMSRLTKDKCDWTVSLPMAGKVTSLNASVAASLLMYEVHRKRHPLGE